MVLNEILKQHPNLYIDRIQIQKLTLIRSVQFILLKIKIRFYVPRRNLYLISLTVISEICVPKEVAKLFEQLQQLFGRVVVDGLHLRRRHVVDDEKRHLVNNI